MEFLYDVAFYLRLCLSEPCVLQTELWKHPYPLTALPQPFPLCLKTVLLLLTPREIG